jgi:hypothetical protein
MFRQWLSFSSLSGSSTAPQRACVGSAHHGIQTLAMRHTDSKRGLCLAYRMTRPSGAARFSRRKHAENLGRNAHHCRWAHRGKQRGLNGMFRLGQAKASRYRNPKAFASLLNLVEIVSKAGSHSCASPPENRSNGLLLIRKPSPCLFVSADCAFDFKRSLRLLFFSRERSANQPNSARIERLKSTKHRWCREQLALMLVRRCFTIRSMSETLCRCPDHQSLSHCSE